MTTAALCPGSGLSAVYRAREPDGDGVLCDYCTRWVAVIDGRLVRHKAREG